MNNSDVIKKHFEEEAKEFDEIIQRLIPNYYLMIEAMISIIPFKTNEEFSIIDLGCGTGTISYFIKKKFPNVKVTCVDISKNMLNIALDKLKNDSICICEDFYKFEFPSKYDVIVSSLALHHLESDKDKLDFYEKIYDALELNGLFINLDVVLGSDEKIQSVYMQKWIEFMKKTTSNEEIEEKWLPKYFEEDRPSKLISHMDFMNQCGFKNIDVIYKYFNYAVYCGSK